MQGAYSPMPSIISAPSTKLPPRPAASFAPVRPSVSPPEGNSFSAVISISTAAANSARPIPIWIFRFGQCTTTPAPNHDPATAATIMRISVVESTGTIFGKMNAWAMVGSVWPTFKVPGMSLTGTRFLSLYAAVVVANDPMPSVSKNAVTNPRAVWSAVGTTTPPRMMVPAYITRTRPSPTNSRLLASTHELVGVGGGQINRRGFDLVDGAGKQRLHDLRAAPCHDTVGRAHRQRVLPAIHVESSVF